MKGKTSGLYITVKFDKPDGSFKVKIDGQNTADYFVNGDFIEVKIPFRPVKVELV